MQNIIKLLYYSDVLLLLIIDKRAFNENVDFALCCRRRRWILFLLNYIWLL